jgi:hypothetical protein
MKKKALVPPPMKKVKEDRSWSRSGQWAIYGNTSGGAKIKRFFIVLHIWPKMD